MAQLRAASPEIPEDVRNAHDYEKKARGMQHHEYVEDRKASAKVEIA